MRTAVFGKMELLSSDQTRPLRRSVARRGTLSDDYEALVVALHQNAALAIGLLTLITSRMLPNILRLEQRLAELTPAHAEEKIR